MQRLLTLQPCRDELRRQPVEQLRVGRRRALRAEVLAGLDEPAPEELLPEPVDSTRAVSGLSRLTSQRARPSRFGIWSSGIGGSTAGVPAYTRSPFAM